MSSLAEAATEFWQWFEGNGDRVFAGLLGDDVQRDSADKEVHRALANVYPGLTCDLIGRPEDSVKECIVSPDGMRDGFDAVKDLVACAPPLAGWKVAAFRPRRELSADMVLCLEDEEVRPADVWFSDDQGKGELALTLFVRGLTPMNRRLRGLGAVLLMDHVLGESDALTVIGSVQAETLPPDLTGRGLRHLAELPACVDAFKRHRYPPPGQLVLSGEGDWVQCRGQIGKLPALIHLDRSLRALAGHPGYDHCLLVSIPDEQADVEGLGMRIAEALEGNQESLLAAIAAHDGCRDLIFYTSNAAAAREKVGQVKGEGAIDVAVQRDSFWEIYRNLA